MDKLYEVNFEFFIDPDPDHGYECVLYLNDEECQQAIEVLKKNKDARFKDLPAELYHAFELAAEHQRQDPDCGPYPDGRMALQEWMPDDLVDLARDAAMEEIDIDDGQILDMREERNSEDDTEEGDNVLCVKVSRADLLTIAKGKATDYSFVIYPEDEENLLEFEEVEEDGKTFLVPLKDDDDMSIPYKYDHICFYSGKDPDGAHALVEVADVRIEQAADEKGYPLTMEVDGETRFLEAITYVLGKVVENDVNPGKNTKPTEGPFLKCLATRQPWAQLIVTGIKDIECKESLPTKPRKVFIAASGTKLKWDDLSPEVQEIYTKYEQKGVLPAYKDLPTKCIVGVVDIVKASTDPVDSPWGCDWPGMKYTLRNAMILDEPIYGKNKATPYFYNVEDYDEEHLPAAHKVEL